MQYQAPLTIKEVLLGISQREYALPAIQREFVWDPAQIEELFDSLMRRYPIGTFLFWSVPAERVGDYGFYDFVSDFDERTPHNVAFKPSGHAITAVLDGQQRLTAFNIALRGSHTVKLPRRRWDDPNAFPKRRLHLDLRYRNADAGPEEPMYRFRFMSDAEATAGEDGEHWFAVADALSIELGPAMQKYLNRYDLAADEIAFDNLFQLAKLVQEEGVVSYFREQSADLDKVLDIFIRVNKGGTKLSYSDLLLSVATAKWKGDAREAIHGLVDEINDANIVGRRFDFDKDRVLKASLVLSNQADIRFKVQNFKVQNMTVIEDQWEKISVSLLLATKLLARFGLSADTLPAQNVVIPVAFYFHHRALTESFITSGKEEVAADRQRIRSWVVRSILRSGVWTGAVDPILTTTRELIKKQGAGGFPLAEIEAAMLDMNKALAFADVELDALVDSPYRHRNSFLVLSLLYPSVGGEFHKDHVFPRSKFTRRRLKDVGVPEDLLDDYIEKVDRLPNLQLLDKIPNEEKLALWPWEWEAQFLTPKERTDYTSRHDLAPLPGSPLAFLDWYSTRRAELRTRLATLLGVNSE